MSNSAARNTWRDRLARWLAGPAPRAGAGARMYHHAKASRLTAGFAAPNDSADAQLAASLTTLRARSRALGRDAPYAKRARAIVVNNVIGSGIGMQAAVETTRGERGRINDAIEAAWLEWCNADSCHTGGRLHFSDLERLAMAQIFEAGEVLLRWHPERFGRSRVPLALEVIEPELLADDYEAPQPTGATFIRMGVEVDRFHRPVRFWLRPVHPGEWRQRTPGPSTLYAVPADFMFHLYPVARWPQTRGEPWLHAVLRRLDDMDGYSEAEIVAARAAASYMAVIETPEPPAALDDAGAPADFTLEPGAAKYLAPGEKLASYAPNRPNPNMDPFMRLMLREVAAGVGVSYESLSRDYSQSNYSSSRLALLDDRDLWRVTQQWFIRAFRAPLHRLFIQQAALAGAIDGLSVQAYAANPQKFEAVRFKPRGWSWIDPTKEVQAYKDAVRNGFTTTTAVIAATGDGRDLEDVLTERRAELDDMQAAGLTFDTDTTAPSAPATPAAEPAPPASADDPAADPDAPAATPPARVVSIAR